MRTNYLKCRRLKTFNFVIQLDYVFCQKPLADSVSVRIEHPMAILGIISIKYVFKAFLNRGLNDVAPVDITEGNPLYHPTKRWLAERSSRVVRAAEKPV